MTLWLAPLFRCAPSAALKIACAPDKLPIKFPRASSTNAFRQDGPLRKHDIDSAATRWKGVFLAGTDKGVSRLTLAEEAIVIPDRNEGKLELHLRNGSVHEFSSSDNPGQYSLSAFAERDLPVQVKSAEQRSSLRNPEFRAGP